MKSTILYVALGIIATTQAAQAQPTITQSIAPAVGDVINVKYCNSAGYSVPSTGASQTWNYAGLTDSASDTVQFVAPSTTPYATAFLAATVAQIVTDSGVTLYNYMETTSSRTSVLGSAFAITESGQTISDTGRYSPPHSAYTYPFTYNSSYTDVDTFTSKEYMGGMLLQTSVIYMADTVKGVGYGTLILPSGTFSNVLMIKAINVETPSGSNTQTVGVQYDFWINGIHQPLLILNEEKNYSNGVLQSTTDEVTRFGASPTTGVNNIAKESNIKLYPNPAGNFINIEAKETAHMFLCDVSGRVVKTVQLKQGANQIDISSLHAGNYFCASTSGSVQFVKE